MNIQNLTINNKQQNFRSFKSRGQHCGDIELAGYLANEPGPVPLVLDLRIDHDRFGSSSDPSLNGNLHYPHNIDRSLNEDTDDKIRKYHSDYNNKTPNTVSFMTPIPSTSGRLHSEFVRLLFSKTHRETDRFFTVSRVQIPQSDRDQSPITLANLSSINLVSIFRCSSSPSNPVYERHVDSSPLGFSLSSHRHSYVGLVFSFPFID